MRLNYLYKIVLILLQYVHNIAGGCLIAEPRWTSWLTDVWTQQKSGLITVTNKSNYQEYKNSSGTIFGMKM